MKTCTVCNQIKSFNSFYKNKSMKNGYRSECKSCCEKRDKEYRLINKDRRLLDNYRNIDKKKGFVCDITLEWLKENITSKLCTYCQYTENIGCDRIDNSKGHTKDNCVPCCTICNTARSDNFTFQEMIVLGRTIKQIREDKNGAGGIETPS